MSELNAFHGLGPWGLTGIQKSSCLFSRCTSSLVEFFVWEDRAYQDTMTESVKKIDHIKCNHCHETANAKLFLLSTELVVALDTQKITMVSCGWAHSMAVNEQGQVFAWGAGEGGQLGLGTAEAAVRIPRWPSNAPKTHTSFQPDLRKNSTRKLNKCSCFFCFIF